MLENLINKNKEPKSGMEYIYLHDMIWKPNVYKESYPMKYGSIMTDVVKLENDSFEFTHKESGERYSTNYGWALAENTEQNKKFIGLYLRCKERLEAIRRDLEIHSSQIIDLNGPEKLLY